jgi:hypothetical protein
MTRFLSAILVLVCAGCTAKAPENAADAVTNTVANAVAPQAKAVETPAPAAATLTPLSNSAIEAVAGANGLPAEVQRFIERREGCEHWAGEPDYDEARRKQIEDAVKELCPGIDTQLAALRKTYARDPEVIAALADFEPLGMED